MLPFTLLKLMLLLGLLLTSPSAALERSERDKGLKPDRGETRGLWLDAQHESAVFDGGLSKMA